VPGGRTREGTYQDWYVERRRPLDCDVWLVTETPVGAVLEGYDAVTTDDLMLPRKHWAAIWSRLEMDAADCSAATTAMARVAGRLMWSSVLPWRRAGGRFAGARHADWTRTVLDDLRAPGVAPAVWGGDWNHSLAGPEWAGSLDGRQQVLDSVDGFGLTVPTSGLAHRLAGVLSIDHIAVPTGWSSASEHVAAIVDGAELSDHDIYVVECPDV
jgi:hypothetical protein